MKGRGYVQDAPHQRTQKPARELLAAGPPVPAAASLEPWEAPILDQGQTASCTGHGTAQGIFTAYGFAGMPLPWVPSPTDIYTLARCLARPMQQDGTLPRLVDKGAAPADVMMAISQWGIRPLRGKTRDGRNSDADLATINEDPDLEDLEADALRILVGEYRIEESDPDAVKLVCGCIAAGIPVGVGFETDLAFDNWTASSAPLGAPDMSTARGGHWVCLTSYRTAAFDGSIILRGVNSWGLGWGDHGHFEATGDWLTRAFDIYALNVARK